MNRPARTLFALAALALGITAFVSWRTSAAQPFADTGFRSSGLERWVGLRCRVFIAGGVGPEFGPRVTRSSGLRTVNDELVVGADGQLVSAGNDAIVIANGTSCVWIPRGMVAAIEVNGVSVEDAK
jgi:hypothetical protein